MYSKAILHSQVYLPKSEVKNLGLLRGELTFTSRFDESIVIPTYTEVNGHFGVPRYYLPLNKGLATKISDQRALGADISFQFLFKLWRHQAGLVDNLINKIKDRYTGFFLVAGAGTGKTIVGIKIIQLIGKTTLVVVPKSDLIKQWCDRILSSTDIKESEIATVENGKVSDNWNTAKITVALVHSLGLDRLPDGFKDHFGLVIYDEADSSIPPTTFAPVACMFAAKYRLGMTATRYRSDGLHKVFELHLGQCFLNMESDNTMKPKACIVNYPESSGYINPEMEFKFRRGKLLTLLSNNKKRTTLIANRIYTCYAEGRDTLVLSDRKEQLLEIHSILTDGYCIPEQTIGFFMRALDGRQFKKDYTKHVLNECKIILGTFQMGSRGTDIPRLSALVLATPHSSMTQISGRIERFLEGKQTPIIIDFVDSAYPDLRKSAASRLKHYHGRGMEVMDIT
jgi:superfamily II DNA or RNA helicase